MTGCGIISYIYMKESKTYFALTGIKSMKRIWLSGGAIALFALAGCASHNVMSRNVETALGVNVTNTDKGAVIDSISQRRPLTKLSSSTINACLNKSVSSSDVITKGRQQSPAAESTGANYNTAGHSDNNASTEWVTGWTKAGAHTLAYRLELETLGDSNYYYYDQLGLSGSRSDNANNYEPVPAWDGKTASDVYGALSNVTQGIQHCLQAQLPASAKKSTQW